MCKLRWRRVCLISSCVRWNSPRLLWVMEFSLQSFIILVLCDLCVEKKSHFTLHRQWIQALFVGIQIEISCKRCGNMKLSIVPAFPLVRCRFMEKLPAPITFWNNRDEIGSFWWIDVQCPLAIVLAYLTFIICGQLFHHYSIKFSHFPSFCLWCSQNCTSSSIIQIHFLIEVTDIT